MHGKYKPFWLDSNGNLVVLDQRVLPFEERIITITNAQETIEAISKMIVRGSGVIGNISAFGIYLSAIESKGDFSRLEELSEEIKDSRPTSITISRAVDRMMKLAHKKREKLDNESFIEILKKEAIAIADEDSIKSKKIGEIGADIIEEIMLSRGLDSINILTHSNDGWLSVVDSGTALAPIYEAQKRGIDIHVWVDETRPRNQGANLTAWELLKSGIEHTIIVDNVGGHLMQQGMVDMVLVGADRVARNGDSSCKIGTYLKALSAKDNDIPFYVAMLNSTFDFDILDGVDEIPIEIRAEDDVKFIKGIDKESGEFRELQIMQSQSVAVNYGFDITPARLITGFITEKGDSKADTFSIEKIFK